jgi:hypothetical protein
VKEESVGQMFIPMALAEMRETLEKKNEDYRLSSNEFSNFYYAANVAGVNTETVILCLIGIKLGRLRGLLEDGRNINYESIADTKKDLANYATILYAMDLSGSL